VPTVFVHGNPEVDAIWTPVLDLLHVSDVVRLSPPGFGSPIPDGFGPSVQEYRAWLIDAVTDIGAPVDIVGHDIGGSTTVTAVMERPDLFRSWVSDSVGVFDPDYVWHHMATAWQTPGVGERAIKEWTAGSHDARLALSPTLARAVLGFYRSAAQPVMADLGRNLDRAAQVPGLAIVAADDHFVGTTEMRERAAKRAGAAVAHIDHSGHRWMLDQPGATAEALERFWATLAR
jgi:pimeloyl-ACP methyl ester carboxylesterase